MTCGCGCSGDRVHLTANFSGLTRREVFMGADHLVVPVVMLRETVVNGSLVTKDQLLPAAWNGTPVTINHPMSGGTTITANSPKVLEKWSIGTIFNCSMKGDKLVGEAWINIALANDKFPGLVDRLEAGNPPMDVSTGYFPTVNDRKGVHNGKPYVRVHTELKPDHLALLPDDVGACSWQDGCGVRANSQQKEDPLPATDQQNSTQAQRILSALGLASLLPQTNARGSDDDRRQIAADLISNDDSPFVPDDLYSLMELSHDSLRALRDTFLKAPPATQKQGDAPVSDKKPADNGSAPATNNVARVSDMSVADFTALVANTAREAATKAVADQAVATHRAALVAQLTSNKELGLTEADLEGTSVKVLEQMVAVNTKKAEQPANQRKVPSAGVNFAGRRLQTNSEDTSGGQTRKFPQMAANAVARQPETQKEDK